MIQTIAEIVIDIAAIAASVGGIACVVYLVSLVLWERHERHAFLSEYRRDNAARRAGHALELEFEPVASGTVRTPALYGGPSPSVQHHA